MSPQNKNNIIINLLDSKHRLINHLETHITPAPTSLSPLCYTQRKISLFLLDAENSNWKKKKEECFA